MSQDNFGFDLAAVEAAAKKHEAIETDIFAYEERVQAVVAVAMELETENYHDIDRINARKDNVLRLWNYLLELLKARRSRLELSLQQRSGREVSSSDIGELVLEKLKILSEVAYIRFASVYRQFSGVSDFVATLEGINATKAELTAAI